MRVAFGVSTLKAGLDAGALDGIGCYTMKLMQRLEADQRVVLSPYRYDPGITSTATVTSPSVMQAKLDTAGLVGPFLRQAAFSLVLGREFRGFRVLDDPSSPDLVHATDHFVPKLKGVPVLATLMDVIPLTHPQWVDYRFKRLMNAAWRKSFRWARRIITISNYSKRQIIEHIGVDEDKVDVIPLGVDQSWFSSPDPAAVTRTRAVHRLPPHFILFVGTIQPRKNLHRLITAHKQLPADLRAAYPLVVVGRYGWGESALEGLLESQADPCVRWLRYVPQTDLPVIVAEARALAFPSQLEGFGLPILEAFAAGTPVIASNCSSIPEVAGGAALLFDPLSEGEITSAMEKIMTDDQLVNELKSAGRSRAQSFSWQSTADMTLKAYEHTIAS